MAVQTRAIKRRIKSVKNTRKITKAMELVSASKMRRAVNSVLASRSYSKLAWSVVSAIGAHSDTQLHPLLRARGNAKKILLVIISSDRGLAGGFNTNITRKMREKIKAIEKDGKIETICIGKRGADVVRRLGLPIKASFVGITNNAKFEEVLPIGRMVIDEFTKASFDKVVLCYTDYVSAVTQTAVAMDLLPLCEASAQTVGTIGKETREKSNAMETCEFSFEPSPREVLDKMLPRIVETIVYQAVLESAASEHSARMMAMRNASDAAGEMIDDLTFTFNQARQAGITQEIAEISSGKAALEG